jgi:prevent-host-death family protein
METIGIRALKERASAVIERAENGEPFVVSRNGRPVALLLPFELDIRDVLAANADAVAERWEAAKRDLAAGNFVDASQLDGAIEESRAQRRQTSAAAER